MLSRTITHPPESASAAELKIASVVAEVASTHAGAGISELEVEQAVNTFCAPLAADACASLPELLEWFKNLGFGQPPDSVVSLQHSNLAWVIEQRRGIPISLAMLLVQGAERCGFAAHGVNYPGHFLVRIDDALIDPLRMLRIKPEELSLAEQDPALTQSAAPVAIGLRMLNNLKAIHVAGRDWSRAMEVTDLQLRIAEAGPASTELCASLQFERGEYWRQLGAVGAAKEAYLSVEGADVPDSLKEKARSIVQKLDSRKETLH